MGDGVALLEFHSKMNSIDDQIIAMMNKSLDIAEKDFRGLVIGNDGANFSAGANICAILMAIGSDETESVKQMVRGFQAANQRLRYSPIPVVTAPFQLALGGGAEVTMGGDAIQATGELYMGLVEVGVGLIPGGGGNMQLLRNVYGPYSQAEGRRPAAVREEGLPADRHGQGGDERGRGARGRLPPGHRRHQHEPRPAARRRQGAACIGMAEAGFRPPRDDQVLPARQERLRHVRHVLYDMQLNNQISEHDRVGRKLATVLTGGDTVVHRARHEQHLLDLELEAFLSLSARRRPASA